MAFTAVGNSASAQSAGTGSVAVAYPSNVTAGRLLTACCSNFGAAIGTSAVTDSQGNTWTRVAAATNGSAQVAIFWTLAGSSAANTVTLTTGGGEYPTLSIYETTGTPNASPFDKTANGTGTSASHATGSTATLAQADEVAFAVSTYDGGTGGTPTVGGSWTLGQIQTNFANMPLASAYQIISATTAQSVTFTWINAPYAVCLATFKAFTGGASGWGPLLSDKRNRLIA
jgi:hypothetical protein